MDPSKDELETFMSLANIFAWAGVDDTIRDAVYSEVGDLRMIRELAGLTEKDEEESFAAIKLALADKTERGLKPVERTRLRLARKAARLRCGLAATVVTTVATQPLARNSRPL